MDTEKYNKDIQQAVEAVNAASQVPSDVIICSNGVKLKLKKIPLMRIQAVMNKFEYPPVPDIWDENRGRAVKNPDHPDYLRQKAEVDQKRQNAVLDAIAALGTEIIDIPESVPSLESDDWIEECEFIGISVDKDRRIARKLAWIKFVALVDIADMNKLGEQFGISMGLSEETVAQAVDSFRSNEIR